jgi:Zn-dependent alcohol dehydrogenase
MSAVVTGLIAVGGEVVVPAGVAARGKVIGVKANKKAPEKALKLALTSLTIDGTTYSIQTKLVTTKAQDNSKSATATTSGGAGASDESGLVFKFTAPVTVNRRRRGGSGGQALRAPARMAGCGENV